jgi:serine/threonine protein kinase/class 3 adenylate cyclase
MTSKSIWFLVLALAGATLSLFAAFTWSPDRVELATREMVANRAAADAELLGLNVSGDPVIRVSAGPREYSTGTDLRVLLHMVPDRQERGKLLAAAPPLRLSARFAGATSSQEAGGELLLEYNSQGSLVGASFGLDNRVPEWLRQPVKAVLSPQLAESLVGPDPPQIEQMPLGLADHLAATLLVADPPLPERISAEPAELLYRLAPDQPGVSIYWAKDGTWMAQLQPSPYATVSYQQELAQSLTGKVVYYLRAAAWLLALGLAWQTFRKVKVVGRLLACGCLLVIGFVPMLQHIDLESHLVIQLTPYLLAVLGALLVWFLGESTLRKHHPDAVEHWDRLIRRTTLAGTGRQLLLGVACGSWLALLLTAGAAGIAAVSSRLINELQGGYGDLQVILPDYNPLPSPLSQGVMLAAVTAALIALGKRFGGSAGIVLGAVLSSVTWSQLCPAAPPLWALVTGLIAAAVAAWLLLRYGLLALLAASITALSLPTAGIAWSSMITLPAIVASLPRLLLLLLGLMICIRSPEERADEGYISELKTLLLSDLVDSTKLVRKLGDSRAADLFGRHDQIARELLRELGGREIDKTDGFLMLFDRPINAVKYALAYHRALKELSDEAGVTVESRVGVHFGEVFLRKNTPEDVARGAKPIEVEGLAKPVAARLMSLAQGRQTLLTRAVYDLAKRSAVSDMDASQDLIWKDHGPYIAKGMDEPIDVYEVGVQDFAPLTPPPSSEKAWKVEDGLDSVASRVSESGGSDPYRTVALPVMDHGMRIGHYRVLDRLGRGGMGEVYMAEDTRLNRHVAIKALPTELASDQESLQRFQREARTVAALDHPNIVTVYSVEEHGGRSYLIMELIEGRSLADMINLDGIHHAIFFEIAIALADALSAAHESGVTHRDLKPSNLMVGANNRLKVLDFGLAKVTVPSADDSAVSDQLTSSGRVLGTMPYMSPEQVRGKPVDHRSDIFSAGIIFYEMLVGKRPFSGETEADLISTIVRDVPEELSEMRSKMPRELRRIIRRCLEKEPDERYQTADELRQDLEQARDELKPSLPRRSRPGLRRKLVVGAGVVVVVAAAGFLLWQHRGKLAPPPPPTTGEVVMDLSAREAQAARLLQSGRLEQAHEAYLKLLEQTPDSAGVRRGLARTLLATGDAAGAIAALVPEPELLQVPEQDPESTLVPLGLPEHLELPDLSLLAEAHHLLHDHAMELALARHARNSYPQSLQVLHLEGVALAALGRSDEASERFLDLMVDGAPARLALDIANELQVHGHQSAACRLYELLGDWYRSPQPGPELLPAVTSARLLLGEPDAAADCLAQMRSMTPEELTAAGLTQVELTAISGWIAALNGDRDEALRRTQELASLDLDRPGGNMAPQIPVAVTLGDAVLAVELLRGALELGLARDRSLHGDPVLTQLAGYPPFDELLAPPAAPESTPAVPATAPAVTAAPDATAAPETTAGEEP